MEKITDLAVRTFRYWLKYSLFPRINRDDFPAHKQKTGFCNGYLMRFLENIGVY